MFKFILSKNITFLVVLFIFSTLVPKNVSAQGTSSCLWVGNTVCVSDPTLLHCEDGCHPRYDCTDPIMYHVQTQCEMVRSCICDPLPTSPPAPTSAQLNLPTLYHAIQTQDALIQLDENTTPGYIVFQLVKFLFPIAGLIFLLILLYGGYTMMLSGGDPKKMAQAKSVLTTGLIGLIQIFGAYWIAQVVGRILGVQSIYDVFR